MRVGKVWSAFVVSALGLLGCSADEPARDARIIALASGDSVEMIAIGPAYVPDRDPGLLVTYHPFFAPDADTARAVDVAHAVWEEWVRPRLQDREDADRPSSSRGADPDPSEFPIPLRRLP